MSKYKAIEKLFLVIILIQMGIIFFVNLAHYNYGLNADIASEGILARLIWESGEWVPSTWYVAEETRVFDVANLAALFYGLTANMQLAVGITCCVMTLGIVLSGYYFVSSLKLDFIQKEIFILLCLILPNNFTILELYYLFACYYSPHIIVLFLTLGMYARILEKGIKPTCTILTLALHFMLGVQGVRGILVIAGPIFAVEIVRAISIWYKKAKYKLEDIKILIWSFLLIVVGFAGGLLPFAMGENLSRNIRNAPAKFIGKIIPDMIIALGLKAADGIMEKVILLFFVVVTLIVFGMIVYRTISKKELREWEWTYLVLFGSPVATAVIATFTTVESTGRYYFVFIMAMAMAAAILYNKKRITSFLMVVFIVGVFVLHLIKVYVPILKSTDLIGDSRYHVVQFLEENGYKRAYSSFEQSNTMTSMCNGSVQVSPVSSFEKMNICKWMASTDWYCPNVPFEEKTAYVVSEYFLPEFEKFQGNHQDTIVFETKIGQYYIYGSEYNYSTLE